MLIAIDFDGVVVDSINETIHAVNLARLSLDSGRQPTRQDISALQDLSYRAFGAQIGVEQSLIEKFEQLVFDHLKSAASKVKLFLGMRECLEELTQRHAVVVVSSNSSKSVSSAFYALRLPEVERVLGWEVGHSKSLKIESALRELTVPASNAVMIGDGVSDIRAGKAASVRTIAVTWGFQPRAVLEKELPDWFVDSPEELVRLIAEQANKH